MRKKILILGHNYVTHFVDIYNQYTRIFDPKEFEVTVAYLTGEPNEEIKQRTLAEHLLFLNFSKKSISQLKIKAILALKRLCKENQYDMVICHRYKPSYIMMWVAHFCKIPKLVFVMHELKTMSSRRRQIFIACFARKNMFFAGVSNAVRDDIRQDLWGVPSERIVTLYNNIDAELVEPQFLSQSEARRALSLPDDAVIFGNLARLVANKDQQTLIHAFLLIKPYCPKAKLVIMGEGALAAQLKQQVIDNQLQDDIIFAGFVPYGFKYMKAFDCFVLSSIQEAFGRVLIEAMLAKRPLIATRVQGIPEVVGEAGQLVEPKDSVALANAMKEIYFLSEAERKVRGEKAYQHCLQHYSIPAFKAQFWQTLGFKNPV